MRETLGIKRYRREDDDTRWFGPLILLLMFPAGASLVYSWQLARLGDGAVPVMALSALGVAYAVSIAIDVAWTIALRLRESGKIR